VGLQRKRGRDGKSRLRCVSLAEKYVKWVCLSNSHAAALGHLGDIHKRALGCVYPSKVDNKCVVDVHKHVIISSKREHLKALVGEACVQLEAKGKVVAVPKVSESFVVQGEEILVSVLVDTGSGLGKSDRDGGGCVVSGVVAPEAVESVFAALDGLSVVVGVELWLAVGSDRVGDDPAVVSKGIFKALRALDRSAADQSVVCAAFGSPVEAATGPKVTCNSSKSGGLWFVSSCGT